MKIYQKLTLGFLGTSLLLGFFGAICLKINLAIKKNSQYLSENSIVEVEISKKMTQSLQSIEAASQELLLEQYQEQLESSLEKEEEILLAKARIENQLLILAKNLDYGQKISLRITTKQSQNIEGFPPTEIYELSLLKEINIQAIKYQKLLNKYLDLSGENPQKAYELLEEEIEPLLRNKLTPLVTDYQKEALRELTTGANQIQNAIDQENLLIIIAAGTSLIFSLILGFLFAGRISRPLEEITSSALRVGQGNLEPISIKNIENRAEELGILVRSFNQMLEGLKKTTVSRSYLDNILSSMLDSLIVIGLDGKIKKVNQATLNLLGYQREELIARSISLILKEEINQLNFQIGDTEFIGNYIKVYLNKEGKEIYVTFSSSYLVDARGDIIGIVCVAKDITEQYLAELALKESQKELRYAAFHDRLTGLPNRAFFNQELSKLITISFRESDNYFAVLFIDLDRFKVINDSLGHQAGDLLLIEVAKKLQISIRSQDLVARLGGDEFVILLRTIKDLNDATMLAERIQSKLVEPIAIEGQEIFVSASIGISLSDRKYNNVKDFLRDADTAMYEAKAKGKACYTVFEPAMYQKIKSRLELEKDLRRAIKQNEFELFYQPIVDLNKIEIIGFEALVRWQHPKKGLIAPDAFIPIAEETRLITTIGWWVLETACQHLSRWQKEDSIYQDLRVSVNISPIQFSQSDFIEKVSEILEISNLAPQYLQLEITETIIISNLEGAKLIIERLKDRGIRVALDDFGTGYSSLSYLYQLPINSLKIDRSFLSNLQEDSDKLEVIKAIVYLAQNLGIDVIAEGVEDPYQKAKLLEHNCQYGQGYLFSKPLPSSSAKALMAL